MQGRDESAFRALVERHLDFVYSAARRRLGGDGHSAADVTQQVFTALARQAAKLPDDVVLPAWLYITTRHLTANWVRVEQSRRAREHAAQHMNEMNVAPAMSADWDKLRPLLDAVIDELGEQDRGAILLRFFSRRSFAEVGAALHVSEDAARMRVERALEKLRAALGRRGVVSTATALGGLLTENAVVAAPAGMVAAVAGLALQSGGGVSAILAFMTSAKFILTMAAAAIVASVAPLVSHSKVESSPIPASPTTSSAVPVPAVQSATSKLIAADLREGGNQRPDAVSSSATSEGDRIASSAVVFDFRVKRLDALVRLTLDQKTQVAALFAKESAILDGIPPEKRGENGVDARVATRKDVRALLSPEQRKKYDISPQSVGGGLPVDPANLVARLDEKVRLTSEQKQKATEVFWDDVIDQVAALPADETLKGFMWRNPVRERLRALLSAEQQATFDATPPYRRNR